MARGSSNRSGPPPDPESLTSRDGEWTVLPAEGRKGEVPGWPLSDPSDRELELWGREWIRPQAVMWERQGQEAEVALYVRSLAAAEKPDASTASRTLVRQQMESLGTSIPGLLRNRWKIGEVVAEDEPELDEDDVRGRLRVVGGGA